LTCRIRLSLSNLKSASAASKSNSTNCAAHELLLDRPAALQAHLDYLEAKRRSGV
jgi:hypothetical protein